MRPARLLPPLVILLVGVGLYLASSGEGERGGGLGKEPSVDAPEVARMDEAVAPPAVEPAAELQRHAIEPTASEEEGARAATPRETTHLAGRVVDVRGEPLAGSEVTFLVGGSWSSGSTAREALDLEGAPIATTDDAGEFSFEGVAPGDDNALFVRHPGLRPELVQGVVVHAFGRSEEPPIVLREGKSVGGTVVNVAGEPIGGARLHLDGAWLPTGPRASLDRLSTTTDELGYFGIEGVPDGKRCLTVSAEGFGTLTRIQSLVINDKTGQDHIVDFQLSGAVELSGRVLDLAGEPVAGAELLAIDRTAFRDVPHGSTSSAADGSWVIDDLVPGTYELRVDADGYEELLQHGVEVPRSDWTLLLQPKRRIEGRVVDAATGEGLERFSLRLRRYEEELGTSHPVGSLEERVAGPEGAFSISAQSDLGPWVVEARATGYAPSYSSPFEGSLEGDVTGVLVEMRRGGELRGRLVDPAGAPVTGRAICRGEDWSDDALTAALGEEGQGEGTVRRARCDAEGRFVLPHLRPGRYQVLLSGAGFSERRRRGLDVNDGEALELGDIALFPGASLRGAVLDADDRPVAGAMVFLQPTDGRSGDRVRRTKSGLEGAWRIADVVPGAYLLSARPPGADLGAFTLWPDRGGEELTLAAGVEDVRDLHLADWRAAEPSLEPPAPPTGELRGVLLRPDGEAVPGAPLELRAAGMGRAAPYLAKTGADGGFVFPAVPPGDYLLSPSGHEARGVEVTVRAHRITEQSLELPE